MTPHTLTDYLNQRYLKLKEFEGEPTQLTSGVNYGHVYAYADPLQPYSIPTIGIGINLRVHLNHVLQTLGFDLARTAFGIGTAAYVAEQGYIDRIRDVVNNQAFTQDSSSTNAVRQALNTILGQRAANTIYNAYPAFPARVTDFAFASTDISKAEFNNAMQGYTDPLTGEHVEGYEEMVDRWLRTHVGIIDGDVNSFLLNRDNPERLALVSLGYSSKRDTQNIPTLFGPNLTKALSNNDRAEVWYNIRYDSNSGAIHASRRYKESDLFNLYNEGPLGEEDYKSAYRTFTRHADDIQFYEQSYFPESAGSTRIQQQLEVARSWLVSNYIDLASIPITVAWDHIQVGENDGTEPGTTDTRYYRGGHTTADCDMLIGTNDSDLIFGESGDDYIDSQGGSDVLYGGLGDDIYYIDARGADPATHNSGSWIEDKQGNNTIVMNGIALDFFWRENGQIDFYSPDKRFLGRYDGTDFVVTDTVLNNHVTLNKDFADGDFGIHLVDRPADPDTTFEWPVLDPDAGLPNEQRTAPNWDGLRNGTAYSDTANGPDASVVLATYVRTNPDGTTSTTEVHPGPISGTNDAEVIHGLGGDDWIDGYGGADRLYGDSGNDVIYFYPSDPVGNALADGGAGRDVIAGWSAGNNHLIGGANDDAADEADLIISAGGNDILDGGQGNDLLFDYLGQDFLDGGQGDDFLFGNANVGFIDATTWSIGPVLEVINGVQHTGDSYTFPAPQMTGIFNINYAPTSDNQGDVLLGGAGNDYLTAGPGDDFLDAGAKDDTGANTNVLYAGLGNDTLIGGAGRDWLNGDGGDDLLFGGDGNDMLFGDEVLSEGGVAGDDLLDGGAGDDELHGHGGHDTLMGGTGDDTLNGGAGDDLLDGGAGTDQLQGGFGDDTYLFNHGDGADTLFEDGGQDTLAFGEGISEADVALAYADGHLIVYVNSGDTVILADWFSNLEGRIETITFASGGAWDVATVMQKTGVYVVDPANETVDLTGSVGSSTIYAGPYWRTVSAGTTTDIGTIIDRNGQLMIGANYYETYGSDPIGIQLLVNYGEFGAPGNFAVVMPGVAIASETYAATNTGTYVSTTGTAPYYFDTARTSVAFYYSIMDVITTGTDGADTLRPDTTSATGYTNTFYGLAGDDTLYGSRGRDIFHGGAGNDTMYGGDGRDIYYINPADADLILDTGDRGSSNTPLAYQSSDTLRIEGDTPFAALAITRDVNDLLIGNTRIQRYFETTLDATGGVVYPYLIESLEGNGWPLDLPEYLTAIGVMGGVLGTSGDDTLTGDNYNNRIYGLGGDDNLYGRNGNDALYGGEGNDWLEGNAGADTLEGGAGRDYFFGGDGDDALSGGAGRDVLNGDGTWSEAIVHSRDILDGGAGNDVLSGGQDGDTYRIAPGSGFDVIEDTGTNKFAANVAALDAEMTALAVSTDSLYLNSAWAFFIVEMHPVPGDYPQDLIDAVNALAWDGVPPAEAIATLGRIKTLLLDDQNDVVEFGAGVTPENIRVLWGDGRSFINEWGYGPFQSSGVLAIDIGNGEGLLLEDVTGGHNFNIETFRFTDGRELTLDQILALDTNPGRIGSVAGTASNDILIGSPAGTGDGSLHGFAGDDLLVSYSGGTLNGGEGSDILAGDGDLNGGVGNDAYLVNAVSGAYSYIGEWSSTPGADYGTDTLSLGGGITADSIDAMLYSMTDADGTFYQSLIIEMRGTGQSIEIDWMGSYFDANGVLQTYNTQIEQIQFLDANGMAQTYNLAGLVAAHADALIAASLASTSIPLFGADAVLYDITAQTGIIGGDYAVTYAANDVVPLVAIPDALPDMNHAPTVETPIADQTASEDSAFIYTIPAGNFADLDASDTLNYTATLADGATLPAWLSFDAITQTFSGTPTNADVGAVHVLVTATDSGNLSANDTFVLTVNNVNDAPEVLTAVSQQSTNEDALFSFTIPVNTFTDIDVGDTLAFTASLADGSALPAWLSFDAASQTFTGIPGNGEVGTLSLRITATDTAGDSASSVFNVVVNNVNDAPTLATPLADQAASEDAPFSFTLSPDTFADVDLIHGDTLTYGATLADGSALPAWLTFDAATRTFSGIPGNSDVGFLSVRVTATDSAGASSAAGFGLGVSNVNDAPQPMSVIPNQQVDEYASLSFALPANLFTDADLIHGDTLSYSATLADGSALPTWLAFDPATQSFSGSPVHADVGTLAVRVTASDQALATASVEFAISVQPVGNAIVGGDAGGWLAGTTGADTIVGGAGTDFISAGDGNDILDAGSGNDALLGGAGNDLLLGGAGNDALAGGTGADTLMGGAGNDVLTGGTGNDLYRFGYGDGQDQLLDADTTAGNRDTVALGASALDIVFTRAGLGLALSLHGGSDTLSVQGWGLGSTFQTEVFQAADGSTLANTQVDQLIQAMATFSANNGGISWDQAITQNPNEVQAVLSAYWQPSV